MAFQEFFKKNFALVIGITLPIILMVAFMLVANNTKRNTVPPKYDFLFSGNSYDKDQDDRYAQSFRIKDGKLIVKIVKKDQRHHNARNLYHYEAESQSIRMVRFDLPAHIKVSEMKKDEEASFELPQFKGKTLNTNEKAKDDYRFMENGYHRSGFIVNELFGSGRNRNDKVYLEKDERRFKIDTPDNYIYSRDFVAWIED